MKDNWQTLVVANPMFIEVARLRRKFLSFQGPSQANTIILVVAIVCYVGLLMVVCNYLGDLPPIGLIMVQTFLFTLLAPALLYGTIAGERERRSWDLLLAAPISKGQIVAGKFMGAMAALGGGGALFLIPIVLAALTYHRSSLYDVMLAEAVSFSFGILVCSFTILVSARARRPLMALGTSIAVLAIALIVVPAFLLMLLPDLNPSGNLVIFLHPAYVLEVLFMAGQRFPSSQFVPMAYVGIPHVLTYLAASATMLVWTEKTLTFAENNVKFLPKHQEAETQCLRS